MFHSPVAFTPPIPPEGYYSPQQFEAECAHVFADSWHLAGTIDQLEKPGDYISLKIMDVPVVVRNFSGELIALRNVCAHRHAQLVCTASGHSETLKCPYHGWEYGPDGLTRKIPAAKNFPQFNRKQYCLDKFAVETCGQLVFVRLTSSGLSLRDWMGERFDMIAEWFNLERWSHAMTLNFEYPCNWKIPIEASLESYHIPSVHSKTFAEDPGEPNSDHFFHKTGTSMQTVFEGGRIVDRLLVFWERIIFWMMGVRHTIGYQHHHIFPNLLVSHTASLTIAQVILPESPTTSRGIVIQVGRRAERTNAVALAASWWWKTFSTWLTKPILNEDIGIYPAVQAGVHAAKRSGILGRCEERLYASQRYITQRINGVAHQSTMIDDIAKLQEEQRPATNEVSLAHHENV